MKQQIIQRILTGAWPPGMQLPTVRQLAVDVSVNVNTVSRVYAEVEREGYIRTRQGRGTFVCENTQAVERSDGRAEGILHFARLVLQMAAAQGIEINEVIKALHELRAPPDGPG